MTMDARTSQQRRCLHLQSRVGLVAIAAMLTANVCTPVKAWSQSSQAQASPAGKNHETPDEKIAQLTAAVAEAQKQMDVYQKQLMNLRQQLNDLKLQLAGDKTPVPAAASPETPASSKTPATSETAQTPLDEVRERQAIQESEIATHETTKVETESKYPLKVSGLLLFNGFVNTRQVDASAAPAYVIPGPGSTGFSVRQTVLGLDARGPHLFNATTKADLRVDFFADDTKENYAASGVLRLRTAHASIDWPHTQAFVELDRSILEPNEPSSLVAVAQPELSWAGNLWTWNPQIGVSHDFSVSNSSQIKAQAAFIDSSDPKIPGTTSSASVTQSERSRWPGTEARIAFLHGAETPGAEVGIGGYFSPHRNEDGNRFDAWAGTMDLRIPLRNYLEFSANAYRGQALSGLGGGGYINYVYRYIGTADIARALDDVGGWTQLKVKAGRRLEINNGFGTDNPFAREIQASISSSSAASYQGLARNRSFFSNVIYSPSAYLLFSLEYRRLWTNYVTGPTQSGDSIGIGAGYRF